MFFNVSQESPREKQRCSEWGVVGGVGCLIPVPTPFTPIIFFDPGVLQLEIIGLDLKLVSNIIITIGTLKEHFGLNFIIIIIISVLIKTFLSWKMPKKFSTEVTWGIAVGGCGRDDSYFLLPIFQTVSFPSLLLLSLSLSPSSCNENGWLSWLNKNIFLEFGIIFSLVDL